MKKILLVLVLVVCIPCYANPEQVQHVQIHEGFLTGRDYLDMPAAQKIAYAMGSIDGMLAAPFFGAPESRAKWLGTCMTGMTGVQIAAILTKYVQDHPEQWHYQMNGLTYNAMQDACNR